MSPKKTNETIARLDRVAARLGLAVTKRGVNKRSLADPERARIYVYQPGGKGIVKVEAYSPGGLEAVAHRSLESMERLLASVSGRTS